MYLLSTFVALKFGSAENDQDVTLDSCIVPLLTVSPDNPATIEVQVALLPPEGKVGMTSEEKGCNLTGNWSLRDPRRTAYGVRHRHRSSRLSPYGQLLIYIVVPITIAIDILSYRSLSHPAASFTH